MKHLTLLQNGNIQNANIHTCRWYLKIVSPVFIRTGKFCSMNLQEITYIIENI